MMQSKVPIDMYINYSKIYAFKVFKSASSNSAKNDTLN